MCADWRVTQLASKVRKNTDELEEVEQGLVLCEASYVQIYF